MADLKVVDAYFDKRDLLKDKKTKKAIKVAKELVDQVNGFKDKEIKDGFKLGGQRYMLTYRTHIDKKHLENRINQVMQTVFFRAAHEKASSDTNYEHTHAVIDFGKACQKSGARIFDVDGIHPHVKIIASMCHFKKAKRYLSKEDPANEDLADEEADWAEQVEACGDLKEVMHLAKSPSMVPGLIAMYGIMKKPEIFRDEFEWEYLPWQKELKKELEGKADRRKIIWIQNPKGLAGKTIFASKLKHELPNDVRYMTSLSGVRDSAQVIKGFVDEGWSGKILIINLPRTAEQIDSIYGPLEMLKDGEFTATKYQGGSVLLPHIPHVVVMANWGPKKQMLTWDRWDIRTLKGETRETLELVVNP